MAAVNASIVTSSTQTFLAMQSVSNTNTIRLVSNSLASSFIGNSLPRFFPMKKRVVKISGEVRAAAAVTTRGFNQPIMCGGEPRAMLRKN
ncbi:hypothetical protein CFP56_027119 [Quercus suber]|uniref:PIFI-like Ig-like domain-containing protein n=1 Tax=Quercus suber TaxID=58331 RepID=A0AAW0JZQ5_QUESU